MWGIWTRPELERQGVPRQLVLAREEKTVLTAGLALGELGEPNLWPATTCQDATACARHQAHVDGGCGSSWAGRFVCVGAKAAAQRAHKLTEELRAVASPSWMTGPMAAFFFIFCTAFACARRMGSWKRYQHIMHEAGTRKSKLRIRVRQGRLVHVCPSIIV